MGNFLHLIIEYSNDSIRKKNNLENGKKFHMNILEKNLMGRRALKFIFYFI